MAVNVDTGESRMLFEDARIGDLVFDESDRALWGLRHADGFVTVVRIPYPYEEWDDVHTFPYGQVPYEIDVSPDGQLLSASMGEISGKQYLRVFRTRDLLDGNIEGARSILSRIQSDSNGQIPETLNDARAWYLDVLIRLVQAPLAGR